MILSAVLVVVMMPIFIVGFLAGMVFTVLLVGFDTAYDFHLTLSRAYRKTKTPDGAGGDV